MHLYLLNMSTHQDGYQQYRILDFEILAIYSEKIRAVAGAYLNLGYPDLLHFRNFVHLVIWYI